MRRAAALGQVLQRAGVAADAAPASSAIPAFSRQMAGHPASHEHHETPLTKVMPSVVALPRQVLNTAVGLTSKLLGGVAHSGAAKSLVTAFAERAIVHEHLVNVSDIDVPFWAYWLSTAGYTNQDGFKKFATAVKPKIAELSPEQVTSLTVAFHKANYYDKDLFTAIGSNISANFAKFETDQLLRILDAFHAHGHLTPEVLDDIADSITYCNHYLAPMKVGADQLATAFAAYAKAGHERGDFFVTLARGISEISLAKLLPAERKATVLKTLRAFHTFQFWPESTDALLYAAKSASGDYSGDEQNEVAKYQKIVEDQVGGELQLYKEGDEDAAHWYAHGAHAPSAYSLYVFRDSLVRKEYVPASLKAHK